jgi:hypothetical protein
VASSDAHSRATIAELEDWERNGAVWRPVEIRAHRAVVDLCSCTGGLMERVQSDDLQFIEYVRARRDT